MAFGVVGPESIKLTICEPGRTVLEGGVTHDISYHSCSVAVLVHGQHIIVGDRTPINTNIVRKEVF